MSTPAAAKPGPKSANGTQQTSSAIVVTTTTSTAAEAEHIGELLIRQRLAACVQMTPIRTKYMWKGNVAFHEETLLVIKTLHTLYPKVQSLILKTATYDLPEVIAQPVVGCSKAYFDWIVSQVTDA